MPDETSEAQGPADETEPSATAAAEDPPRLTRPAPDKYPDKFVGKVGRKNITFIVKRDRPAVIWDMITRQAVNQMFVRATAIGLYWFGDKPAAANERYSNAISWGESVADELYKRGWSPDDIWEVGGELLEHAAARLPDAKQQKEEADFFG